MVSLRSNYLTLESDELRAHRFGFIRKRLANETEQEQFLAR